MKRKGNVLIIVALAGVAGASYKVYKTNAAEEQSHVATTGKTFATKKIAESPKPAEVKPSEISNPKKVETAPLQPVTNSAVAAGGGETSTENENSPAPVPNVTPEEIQEELHENLLKDEKIQLEAEIRSIVCNAENCKIEAEAKKEDDSGFQMAFVNFLQAHPEFGNKIDINQDKRDKHASFTYYNRNQ